MILAALHAVADIKPFHVRVHVEPGAERVEFLSSSHFCCYIAVTVAIISRFGLLSIIEGVVFGRTLRPYHKLLAAASLRGGKAGRGGMP